MCSTDYRRSSVPVALEGYVSTTLKEAVWGLKTYHYEAFRHPADIMALFSASAALRLYAHMLLTRQSEALQNTTMRP